MADPNTAGGGTEGLRLDLARTLFVGLCPYSDAESASRLWDAPEAYGYRNTALRFADALLAGPIARASAEQARVEAENALLTAERDRLLIAFHDAIRRPLGVTPDSGAEFYSQRMADEAEERRAAGTRRIPHAQ